jgi:dTDP-4-dehydrorhamnose 3,5-epimerase
MKLSPTAISDVVVLEPTVFQDARGFFFESYNEQIFRGLIGRDPKFVQDNHSGSSKGVLRGLHYQLRRPQAKLVRVVRGATFNVAVDIRRSSRTFGQWVSAELTDENQRQLWIPTGFAHGFIVVSDWAEVVYKASEFYDPDSERQIAWNDPSLGIRWPLDPSQQPILSPKDQAGTPFAQAELFA